MLPEKIPAGVGSTVLRRSRARKPTSAGWLASRTSETGPTSAASVAAFSADGGASLDVPASKNLFESSIERAFQLRTRFAC